MMTKRYRLQFSLLPNSDLAWNYFVTAEQNVYRQSDDDDTLLRMMDSALLLGTMRVDTMICTEIDLESSLHILSKHKLRLEVTASARISLPRPDSVFLTSLTLPQIFTSTDTWVSLGPELKLTVDTYLNGTVRGPGQATLALGGIGEILGHAELWSNLGLVTSQQNPETTLGDQDAARLVYTVQPDPTLSQDSQGRRAHNPTKNVHGVNIQPPEGIPMAVLQEIKVSLRFLPAEQRSKPLSYPKIKQADEDFVDLLFSFDYSNRQIDPIGVPGAFQPELPKSQDIASLHPHPTRNYREYLEDDSPFSSQESQLSFSHPWQGQVTRDDIAENVDIEPYIMLTDSGFRSLICDKPMRTAAGIKTHFDEPRIELADVGPAIFSPRYLSSISQRAGYVPMIAKSINAMLERTKSLRLKERIKLLEESHRARTGTASDESTASVDTRSTLKCLLWMTLQRGVFDRGAARRLESLHASKRMDVLQTHVEKQPTAISHQNEPDSDPMIEVPDDTPFEAENYMGQPANEDPDDDLLFSELGLYEEDDQPHDPDPFDENLHYQQDTDMEDDILDPPTSPSLNPSSPTLPAQISSKQPIPMGGVSSLPLSMPRNTLHPEPIYTPPSSPPPNPNENQGSDDMLLS